MLSLVKHSVAVMCSVVLGACLLASPRGVFGQDSNKGSTLRVRISYSGTGAVDEKHKIYAVLWDSPDFVSGGAIPIEIQSIATKSGVITFEDVRKTPAYVSSVYDSSGTWDAQSPPPEGSPIGLYSKTPGKPEPIELTPGKATTIELTFDDQVKMHSGGPSR